MNALKQTLLKFKWIIIGGITLLVLMVVYNLFFLEDDRRESTGLVREENTVDETSAIGREIIRTLNKISTITIDPDFFELASFRRLEDFSTEIEERPVGKDNPFLPFDGNFGAESSINLDEQSPLDQPTEQLIPGGQIN